MPDKPSNLGQFWKELKRRRVVHVITVYATTAFVIIELVNNLAESLNLPAGMPTIVIAVLAVGFPLVIILSWLYDLTSEGIEKTKALSETQEGEKTIVPNAYKIATYVSFAVIIGLVVLNVLGGSKSLRAGDIQSLVILPFKNFTGDDQLEWFVEGMHASLIQDVQRIGGLRVMCKTTSNVYKNTDMSASEIASELDVDAVMEVQVMCLGDSICTLFNLIQVSPEEKQVLSADIKEGKRQILSLYNRITKQIADKVKIELTADEELLLAESREVDPDAVDAYYKGLFHWERLGEEDLDSAMHYFQIAINKDPDWAAPYAGMHRVLNALGFFGYISRAEVHDKSIEYLNKALELDPNSANSHYNVAVTAVWGEWDWKKGEKEFSRTLELNPNDALCRMYYAHLLSILRRHDEALDQANLGLELDPMRSLVLGLYGVVMHNAGDYQSALTHLEKAVSIDPDNDFVARHLAVAYLETGDTLKWYERWKRGLLWTDDEYLASLDSIFQEYGYLAVIEERIRVKEDVYNSGGRISFQGQAKRYLTVGKYDKAMDYLEKSYERHDGGLAYVSLLVFFHPELKYNPRYIALLKKMNLPLPNN